MARHIRLLHISDLHFAAPTLDLIARVASRHKSVALSRHLQRFSSVTDAVLVTGDLAHTGLPEDLDVASSFLATPNAGRPYLGSNSVPRFMMPGNHDRYRKMTALRSIGDLPGLPGGTFFDSLRFFGHQWRAGQGVQLWTLERDSEKLTIVGADFTYSGERSLDNLRRGRQLLGGGIVSPQILSELEGATELAKQRSAVVWAIHFSPGTLRKSNLELEGWERLLKSAIKLNIQHIFCGHIHKQSVFNLNSSGVYIHRAGSAVAEGSKAEFQWIGLRAQDREIVEVITQPWRWKSRKFVPELKRAKYWQRRIKV